MKVLHVIASVDPRGGGPIEGVFSSTEVWSRHGLERNIVSLDPPHAPWLSETRAPTTALGSDDMFSRCLHRLLPRLRYGYTHRLTPWLRAHADSYDAVIINGLWNYSSLGAWRALHKMKTPYFIYPHGMLDPWFNRYYPVKTFFKSIYWRLFEHRVLRDAAGVLFTCEEERQLAQSTFSPYVAREYVVGYGAHDVLGDASTQRAAFMAAMPATQGRKLILFLGRLHEKKGVDLLVKAFARNADAHPDYDLVIAGPDQRGLRPMLTKLASELGVAGRIHWPGMLTGDAKWGAIRSAEVFVLPSHQENFGIVVTEAMALSKPLLITNKVNIWREVQADGAGLVINDDIDQISEGLRRMLLLSDEERAQMGAASRRSFEARFDLEMNALALLAVVAPVAKSDVGDRSVESS